MTLNDLYPLTILRDRYGGTCSGAEYLAFNVDPWGIPEPVGGSDPDERIFWSDPENSQYVGKGESIMEAVENLLLKINTIQGEGI